MKSAIELVKKMSKDIESNWLPSLEEINLHTIFGPLYKSGYKQKVANQLTAFIIFSYDNDSQWLDVRKDRFQNKEDILTGLDINPKSTIFAEVLRYENDDVQEVILNYLLRQTDARWYEIMSLLDYSTKMLLFCNRRTNDKNKTGTEKDKDGNVEDTFEYLDESQVTKINKEKGELLIKAIDARKHAEELLEQLHKDYVKVDSATQGDFDFQFSDASKFDLMNWSHRVRKRKLLTAQ